MGVIRKIRHTAPMHQGSRLVRLKDVLSSIEFMPLRWRILELEIVLIPESTRNAVEIDRKSLESFDGLAISQTELVALSLEIDQAINCEVRGYRDWSAGSVIDEYELLIRGVDSSYWEIEYDPDRVTIARPSLLD